MIRKIYEKARSLGFQLVDFRPRTNPNQHWTGPGFSFHMTAGPARDEVSMKRLSDFELSLGKWVQSGQFEHDVVGTTHAYSRSGIKILWNRKSRGGMEDAHHHLVIYATPEISESHPDLREKIRPFIRSASRTAPVSSSTANPAPKNRPKRARRGDIRPYFDQL